MMKYMVSRLFSHCRIAVEDEYAPMRRRLLLAGLSEKKLRRMDPDARVALLEKARLDPYDYIFLAC